MNTTQPTDPRDRLFTLARDTNDGTFTLMVAFNKVFAMMVPGPVPPELLDDLFLACKDLHRRIDALTDFLRSLRTIL